MRLLEVGIKNFKSLRDVTFRPGDLNVLIGPNGAGKSNLADALDFIGEMYRHGLQQAIAGRGGFDTIVTRHPRRKSPTIALTIIAGFSHGEMRTRSKLNLPPEITVVHSLEIQSGSAQTGGGFSVARERITYEAALLPNRARQTMLELHRDAAHKVSATATDAFRSLDTPYRDLPVSTLADFLSDILSPQQSMLHSVETSLFPLVPVRELLGTIYTSQISVGACRKDGIPGPATPLGRHGENLPAVVEVLERARPDAYSSIVETLMTMMPTLEALIVEKTPQEGLRLRFRERGFTTPWTVGQISDGTVRTLGLLAALLDPASSVTIVEEPENSLHPWAISEFAKACRQAAKTKQIFLTTHSPILIDQFRLEDVWVVSKRDGQTLVEKLDDLDPNARIGWEEGDFTLSQYLGSGIVRQAVPVSPL